MSDMEPETTVFQHSIAISMKRIADSLESIQLLLTPARVVGTSHADELMRSSDIASGLRRDLAALDVFFGPGIINVDSKGVARIARLD